jgi:hypothetical protein
MHLLTVCAIVALLWIGGNFFYGWALPWMQSYGPVLGWPICLVSCNISAALVECAYGDWKGRSLAALVGGLGILTASVILFAYISLILEVPQTTPSVKL